ncbi:Flp family type IVb pilin [Tropicimonas aquimaris]|uniref:Flp family type IVb pilin n=1 Tax=Tropicimonas aquimaris TaxID=914152 RepID=A0ABW3IP36_9RHOB
MKNYLTRTFKRFTKDEKGVTLVEYGIALVLAVGLGTAALTELGGAVGDKMGEAETKLAPQATGF